MSNIKVNRSEQRLARELSIDYDGFNYHLIFGSSEGGGFFAIPNHGACGELGSSDDVFYNSESITRALVNHRAGKALALVIKEVGYND